jgi:putative endonuclease
MAFVYILKSRDFPITYVGSTTDLQRRLDEHNSGSKRFTNRHKPWDLVYSEEITDLSIARKREKYLKSGAGRRFITKHIHIPR